MTSPDQLQRTLARMLLQHPFLATLALRLERVADATIETAWTDGVRLAVNPIWFAGLDDAQRASLVAHECFHVALAHHLRRGSRDHQRWNAACDYAVNSLLVADGFTLFPDALYDPAFGDASAEAIYNQLPTAPDDPDGNGGGGSPSPGSAGVDPGAAGAGTPRSGPAGAPAPPETIGEVRDQPFPTPPTPAELQSLLAQHAILVAGLAQQARGAGRDSAGASRAAAAAAGHAAVSWRTLLNEFLSSRSAQDYSWRRPNPRYAALGVYIPIIEAAAPSRIAFVLDTSGSVPAAALEAVTSELEAYLGQYPTTVLQILYADAAVAGGACYTAADLPLRLEPKGGGGTSFSPALQKLEDDDDPPACIVYFTDLRGRFPEVAPTMPVLWLVFGQPIATPKAPFGRIILLPY